MYKFARILLLISIVPSLISAQSNPDDYWLGNGFANGDTVYTNAGFFYDDGGFNVYQENQDWSVTFCSENSNPLTLDFSGFRTHFGGTIGDGTYLLYDYMSIDFAGESYYAYHNDTPEFSFTSSDGCITIGFHSDGDGQIDSGWVAEIYALPPPINNDPSTAEELVVGNVCSPSFYSNKGAYNTTTLGSPPCKTYFGGDVWFTVVVPPSGTLKIETIAGTLTYAILDIYSSDNSTILASERIACVDDGGAMPTVTLSAPQVSPGERLYIRVFGEQAKSGLFGICASDITAPVTGYTGPGGVGDSVSLAYWFLPDSGILNNSDVAASNAENVKSWVDQSGNGMDLVQASGANQPVYATGLINGFGGIQFDGVDDLFTLETGSGDAPLHWFVAGAFSGSTRQSLLSIGDAFSTKTASISRHTDDSYFSFTDGDRYGPTLTADQFYLMHASHEANAPYHFLELNGLSQTVGATPSALESDGTLKVGASWDNNDPFNGSVSEIIQFRKTLNEAQEIIVNNYLSAKYNIDLDANNFYPYKSTHYYDVAGIGRVDADNTHTKAASAGVLAISGADDLDDNEFMFVGHDNGDFTTWTSNQVPSGDTNIVRLERVWRVALEGDPGNVSIGLEKDALPSLPSEFAAYNILVDADGDFSTGAVTYGPFEFSDAFIVNNVAVSAGDYLTIAAVRPVISFTALTSESLENIQNPTIEIEINYPISETVEVNYAVVGGTATQGTDFSLVASSVTLDPGSRTVNIVPLIIDDAEVELPDEYFDIQISTPTAGVVVAENDIIRHTILNDDLAVGIIATDTVIGACGTSFTTLVAAASGTGPFTYTWTPAAGLSETNNDTVVANPASTTLYTVTVEDVYANTENAEVTVVVVPSPPKPTILVDGSTAICEGDSVRLIAPDGYSTYNWSNGLTNDSIWVSETGNYNVIVTDSFGCSSTPSDDVNIVINPVPGVPIVTLVGSDQFCAGDSALLIGPAGFDGYLWSDGSTDDSLVVKTTGDYTLTVSNGFGCTSPPGATQTITVWDNPGIPAISIDGSTTFCEEDSVVLSAPAGFPVYAWSDGSNTESITVKTGGDYSVYVEDPNGCRSPDSNPVTVIVNTLPEAPTIDPAGDTTICDGDNVLLVPSGSFPVYTWSDGLIQKDRTVSLSGTYAVSVTDGNGCTSALSDPVNLMVNSLPATPVIAADGPTAFCDGDSVILSVPEGSAAYQWSDGSTGNSVIVKTAGAYNVFVTDNNGCISAVSDDIDVTVNSLPDTPVISADGPLEFCEGESVTLSAPAGFVAYTWSDGGDTQERIISTSGDLSVFVEDANGCLSPSSEVVTVTVNSLPDQPVISPPGPIFLITGDSVTLTSSSAAEYLWSPGGETTMEIDVKTSGDYSVVVRSAAGCESIPSEPVSVTVSDFLPPPEVTVNGETAFCEGGSVLLSGPDGFSAYNWSDGSTGQEVSISLSGSITLVVTDSNGNTSLPSEEVIVTVYAHPDLSLVESMAALCFGDVNGSLEVSASGGEGTYAYVWTESGSTGPLLGNIGEGTYEVTVTDENGCGDTAVFDVVQPGALMVEVDVTNAYCPDFTDGEVTLSISGGTDPVSVEWDNGAAGDFISDLPPGEFSYTISDGNNCSSTGAATVDYDNDFCFEVPGIITPNDDGYNDFWRIDGLEVYPDVAIEVFDRWGKRVFYSEGHDTYFDGTFDGRELPMESYHYVIDLNNGTERIIGNITIVR